MHALVIDDARAMRLILRQMLGKLGFRVSEAGDGDEGLRQLRLLSDVVLVLVDANMPRMDGFTFVRAVRAEQAFDSLRLVMVTGEEEKSQADRALQSGADEYLVKPFTRDQLLAKLQKDWTVSAGTNTVKSRVLVVDDAVVVRRMVANELSADPALEVIGTAANGRIALAKIERMRPDIVTLDLEMPEMDGLATLAVIRQSYPLLPVIICSRFTQRGASAAMNAIALGANECVALPLTAANPASALNCIREQLIPRLKRLAVHARATATSDEPSTRSTAPADTAARASSRLEAIAIGVSTGGPAALTALLAAFPADLPVPALIVQHMPPMFTRLLADRLAMQTSLRVREGEAGQLIAPGEAWLAPGNHHMEVARYGSGRSCIQLQQGPPQNSCRPSVDVLFQSVAETFGSGALAVVLTGMGRDGLLGCEAIRAAGGQVFVQDEQSSVVWGMPGAVARAGLADKVLPLDQLGPEIVRRVRQSRATTTTRLPRVEVRTADLSTVRTSAADRKEPPCR